MRRHEGWMVSCALLLCLSACSTLPRPVPGGNRGVLREADVRNRWVGVTKLGVKSCPAPRTAGWIVEPLFSLEGLDPKLREAARKAKLHRFCVYEYRGPSPVLAERASPSDGPSREDDGLPRDLSALLRSFERDRVVLYGSGLEEITRDSFYKRFRKEVEIPATFPTAAAPSRVRLAFLDTQPDGEGFPVAGARSPHGYSLMHIAGDLAGPLACREAGSSCAIEVASRLALPVVSFETAGEEARDGVSGGSRGTFVDLSRALWAEIMNPLRPPHLVLNLSVGWDGEKYGGWEEELSRMTPEVWGIHGALRVASDLGILVIAAAGNELEGPEPKNHRPLLPAGWESQERLSDPERREWTWRYRGEPFIYAASGIDSRNYPLVNTRGKGEAPRVAYADHVVVPDLRNGSHHTATLTGTSVSTAVVATAAAAVWSYRPGLRPAEVMQILSESVESLPRETHFSDPSEPAPAVRRITLCGALRRACSGRGHCSPPDCGWPDTPRPEWELFEASWVRSTPTSPPSPATSYPDVRDIPWIVPQPGVDPCPNCAVGPPDKRARSEVPVVVNASLRSDKVAVSSPTACYSLLVEIPADWVDNLQEATLELFKLDRAGRKTSQTNWSIDTSPLRRGELQLKGPFCTTADPFQASLSFVLDPPPGEPKGTRPLSIDSPIFVD